MPRKYPLLALYEQAYGIITAVLVIQCAQNTFDRGIIRDQKIRLKVALNKQQAVGLDTNRRLSVREHVHAERRNSPERIRIWRYTVAGNCVTAVRYATVKTTTITRLERTAGSKRYVLAERPKLFVMA